MCRHLYIPCFLKTLRLLMRSDFIPPAIKNTQLRSSRAHSDNSRNLHGTYQSDTHTIVSVSGQQNPLSNLAVSAVGNRDASPPLPDNEIPFLRSVSDKGGSKFDGNLLHFLRVTYTDNNTSGITLNTKLTRVLENYQFLYPISSDRLIVKCY